MAQVKKKKTQEFKLTDNQRWVIGFILLFISCFILIGIVSYFFTWSSDQDLVRAGVLFSDETKNLIGPIGAYISHYFVGQWFGLFSVMLPIVLLVISLRIMRFRPPYLKRMIRILLFVMILGSVSLGFLFGSSGSFYGTGLGGASGIHVAGVLKSIIGGVGTGLLLLTLIVLLGVYINKNTISLVNKVGKAVAKGGSKIVAKKPLSTLSDDLDEHVQEPENNIIELEAYETQERTFDEDEIEIDDDFEIKTPPNKEIPLSIGGVIESETSDDGFVEVNGEMKIVVAENTDEIVDDIEQELYDPTLELSSYERPPLNLLEDHSVDVKVTEQEIYEHKNRIVETLNNFGISVQKIMATIGPTVTLYEIIPAPGVRISKIKNLEDDIALSLSALGIRIIAPIPGKGTIGIEVPNKDKEVVSMQSVVRSMKFQETDYDLPIVLGKTISNETYVMDLAKMPHLLIAGATGQGKSVGLNAILTSLLYKKHPSELKLVLVDPKKVELTLYSKLEKHFLAKMPGDDDAIITDTHKVINTLNSLCVEMDARYDLLKKAEVRQLKEYNDKFTRRRLNPEKGHRYLPYIVVVIDEFADMIMTAGREIETPIARIAQLARAVGIHLVIATQRPTTNIITGLIKANFPSRIAFRVTSMIDSRTILDTSGANQLIGRGDMLVSSGSDLVRVQCAFVDTPEVEKITSFIANQRGYIEAYELPEYSPEGVEMGSKGADLSQTDPMFKEVAYFIVQNQQGSTSSIQRRFSIGYNRAGRIMDQIEAAGIVGRAEGSKPREVLITDLSSLDNLLSNLL